MAIPTANRSYYWAVHGTQSITDSAAGFTSTNIRPTSGDLAGFTAKCVRVRVESAALRWRQDGTDPTSSTGTIQNPFEEFYIEGPTEIKRFRAIRTGDTSATIKYDVGF
jgi:hypothetical protein